MISKITCAGLTDRGLVRQENQDRWAADAELGLFLVSDGIGGGLAGALAARIVAEALPPLLRACMHDPSGIEHPLTPATRVERAIAALSDQVRTESKGQPGLDGMGATVVLALVHDPHAIIAHLGDSRAYLVRNARIEQLTKDHSIVQLLIDNGEIRPEQAAEYPERGRLTRYVGTDGEALPEARAVELCPGDQLLLCSDGLSGMVCDAELLSILHQAPSPEAACRDLIAAANAAGGRDNSTAVVIRLAATEPATNGKCAETPTVRDVEQPQPAMDWTLGGRSQSLDRSDHCARADDESAGRSRRCRKRRRRRTQCGQCGTSF